MSTDGVFDPATVRVTHHAVLRYLERRGWAHNQHNYTAAEDAIRALLERVKHKRPPLEVRPDGTASRRYSVGELRFVLTADCDAVLTCYHKAKAKKPHVRGRRGGGRKSYNRKGR